MTTGTMHMGGYAAGAARLGDACPAHLVNSGIPAPVATTKWHATNGKQVSPVFATDRPTRRLLERFP